MGKKTILDPITHWRIGRHENTEKNAFCYFGFRILLPIRIPLSEIGNPKNLKVDSPYHTVFIQEGMQQICNILLSLPAHAKSLPVMEPMEAQVEILIESYIYLRSLWAESSIILDYTYIDQLVKQRFKF
jgi:hypothetical protein